jgi:hypothetical protein
LDAGMIRSFFLVHVFDREVARPGTMLGSVALDPDVAEPPISLESIFEKMDEAAIPRG